MIRLALFASGSGSNALNLLNVAKDLTNVKIPLLIIDQASSPLLTKAKALYPNLEVRLIEAPKGIAPELRKPAHEAKILEVLNQFEIEWCFLAGYMRILGETLLKAFRSEKCTRIVNIHPSLLPAYPGIHSYERAFSDGVEESGVTIHFVDGGVDTGPIILQNKFKRLPNETLDNFKARGLELEWQMYASVLRKLDKESCL